MAKRTFEDLVARVIEVARKGEKTATATEIAVGQAAHRAVLFRVRAVADVGSKRRARSEAIAAIGTELQAASCKTSNVNRAIQTYNTSEIFGNSEAKTLPLSAVRIFSKTIKRDTKKEAWSVKEKIEERARAAWAAVVAGEMSATSVIEQVTVLAGEGKKPRKARPKPSAVERILGQVDKLSEAEQKEVALAIAKKLGIVKQNQKPKPAAAPIPDEPTIAKTVPLSERRAA